MVTANAAALGNGGASAEDALGMLGVSITGKRWVLRQADERAGMTLAQRLGVPDVVGQVLAGRGFEEIDAALSFLTPKLSDLPDPLHLLDMDKAVECLVNAVTKGRRIAVFGDYDVDGGCSSALLLRFFRSLGCDPLLYIPDRMTEGYGPSVEAMDELKAQGAEVVVTVDCGSVAFGPMSRARELGLDVVITDHHQTLPELPACVAFVNPNRVDETSDCGMLCGAGVAFFLVLAVRRALRERGFFTAERLEPRVDLWLDLVAVATICDMVPLTSVNRALVSRGLQVLATRQNIGLAALADVAGVTEKPGTYHVGFLIGPRINAGGRLSDCSIGARLLATENEAEAQDLAMRLHLLNEERKRIEMDVVQQALEQAAEVFTEDTAALVVGGEGWHEGVIGIVASRVKEVYNRPVMVLSYGEEHCKGSGRSIPGLDLGRAVIECRDILIKGGGHKMAAGLSVAREQVEALRERLNGAMLAQVRGMAGRGVLSETQTADGVDSAPLVGHPVWGEVFTPCLKVDGFLTPAAGDLGFLSQLERLEPYGTANAEPKFVMRNVRVTAARPMGAEGMHLGFTAEGAGGQVRCVAFKVFASEAGPVLMQSAQTGKKVSLCGTLRRNSWNGRETVQFQVLDVM